LYRSNINLKIDIPYSLPLPYVKMNLSRFPILNYSFSKLKNFFIYKGSVNSKITTKKLQG